MNFKKKIAYIHKKGYVSYADIAKLVGCSKSAVSHWVNTIKQPCGKYRERIDFLYKSVKNGESIRKEISGEYPGNP